MILSSGNASFVDDPTCMRYIHLAKKGKESKVCSGQYFLPAVHHNTRQCDPHHPTVGKRVR